MQAEDSADNFSVNASGNKDTTMATMALPLREMSVTVQREAVSAQMAYWSLAEEVANKRFQLFLWVKTRSLNASMGRLAEKQKGLIEHLQDERVLNFTPEVFGKLASDLDNVVALTNSFLDEAHDMPPACQRAWECRLTIIADHNAHLDNYAESFRVASDEACTSLLADIAERVTADAPVAAD